MMRLAMESTPGRRPYYLLPQKFVCEVAEGGVVLDLRANQYFGLSRAQMQVLGASVLGWSCRTSAEALDSRAAQEIVQDFVHEGLLTEDTSIGKDASPIQLPRAEDHLIDLDISERPQHLRTYLRTMAACCASSLLFLKGRSLEYAVRRVEDRKRHLRSSSSFDLAAARKLTHVFYWLSPLFYTARDHCLYDSLVLMEFLARCDLHPTWVIGVKAFAPFSAHSWVQHETYALTESPERLRAYTPILAV